MNKGNVSNYEQVKRTMYFNRMTNTASSFENALWDLFYAADEFNLEKLRRSFPDHVEVFNNWRTSGGDEVFFKKYVS